ncbi:hypothetical protein ROZALSC1DRAFT_15979 [Rozella allomycis CSF55]|uniref:Reverse transcriptase domain-containing protein n=1 Tax=Rozella allomycis (strain CSF55) TaxID=988480 RepID=A0A4P9YFK0_ROZAC|nr:hypothetical protein ROZALSC1DRAFT_15979 [Rozella allomycis CSF55]
MRYIDDIAVKGERVTTNNDEVENGIRKFIRSHLEDLEKIFERILRSKLTVSGMKCSFCVPEIEVFSYLCNAEGRRICTRNREKILEWPRPESTKDVHSF